MQSIASQHLGLLAVKRKERERERERERMVERDREVSLISCIELMPDMAP